MYRRGVEENMLVAELLVRAYGVSRPFIRKGCRCRRVDRGIILIHLCRQIFFEMTFKFEAKYGLLTYSQAADLDPFEIVLRLSSLGAECIVGREKHQDGGTHYHAFFMFERKFASRNSRVFDVGGCHPNIVRGYGTPECGWDYATKDGDICAGGLDRPSGISSSQTENKWAWIITASNREEFFERIASGDPRSLCTNFGNLQRYADWKYRPEPIEYEHPRSISFDGRRLTELTEWSTTNIGGRVTDGEFQKSQVGWM